MQPIDHLLAATDFSPGSLHAVERGFLLAERSGARYTILHVPGLDALSQLRDLLGARAAQVSEAIVADARDALARIASDPSRSRGVQAELRVEPGYASSVVPEFARSNAAGLILIGAHGAGFVQRLLLGSTASRLLRKSPCPVLVVRQACRGPYRRALVAFDFSPGSRLAVAHARSIAPQAELVLLHVFDVPFEGKMQFAGVDDEIIHAYRIRSRQRAVEALHEAAADAGLSPSDYTAVVVHGEAASRILEHEESYGCDLIVMGKHGTHVTEEMLLGSVTKHVLARSENDVLVIVDEGAPVHPGLDG